MRTTERCVMMKFYHAILLCLTFCICGIAAVSWPPSCCLRRSNYGINVHNVVGCTVQQAGICPFNAIKINTNRGRSVCFDLDSNWVSKNVVVNGTACHAAVQTKKKKRKKKKGRKRSKKHILFEFKIVLSDDTQDLNTDSISVKTPTAVI